MYVLKILCLYGNYKDILTFKNWKVLKVIDNGMYGATDSTLNYT